MTKQREAAQENLDSRADALEGRWQEILCEELPARYVPYFALRAFSRAARRIAAEQREACAAAVDEYQRFFKGGTADRYDEGARIALWAAANNIRALSSSPKGGSHET